MNTTLLCINGADITDVLNKTTWIYMGPMAKFEVPEE